MGTGELTPTKGVTGEVVYTRKGGIVDSSDGIFEDTNFF